MYDVNFHLSYLMHLVCVSDYVLYFVSIAGVLQLLFYFLQNEAKCLFKQYPCSHFKPIRYQIGII